MAALSVLVPAPARAEDATAVCQTVLRSTPRVTADLDGDGNPEYTLPAIYDIAVCGEAGASYEILPPRIERCHDGWDFTCVAVYVTLLPVSAQAGAGADLCYTVEGQDRTCSGVDTPPLPNPPRQTVCIGVDVNGGFPCSSGALLSFD